MRASAPFATRPLSLLLIASCVSLRLVGGLQHFPLPLRCSGAFPRITSFAVFFFSSAVEREPRYVCDFEADMCDFMTYRDHMDMDLYFRRDSGATETPGTGPSFDHTLGPQQRGHYTYMDSPGYVAGASATVLGRPAIYPAGLYCVRLFYHMWGDDVNSLRMYMHALKHDEDITGDWGKPLLLRIGDHGDEWLEGGFEFRSDGRTAQQLVIEALAGFSEKGDIAVDDISLSAGRCEENIKRDAYQGDYICGEVRLVSGDWSEEKSWYVEGAVSCAGRGYSYDSLRGSWMPCCVPRYGDYTLVLHDGYGDGWSGSKIEFRFFDESQTFGEDFVGMEEGVEKKYTLNVGLVHITRIEGSSDSIRLEVQVAQPQSYVWCGAALSVSPAPTIDILKKYGIRSQSPTSAAGEKVLLEIKNKPQAVRVLQPHTDYNVYCYAEPAAAASLAGSVSTASGGESAQHPELQQELQQQRQSLKQMDDQQVAASRTPVTTDNTPTALAIEEVEVDTTSATVHLHADEACTVYCLALETSSPETQLQPPSANAFKSKNSSKLSILKDEEHVSKKLKIRHLTPDTWYKIFCYAEDRALPRPNASSAEDVRATMVDLQTPTKVPQLTISSYEAFVRGFRVHVKSDTPAKVWCAAAMSGSAYPKKEDVKRVGATVEIQNIEKAAKVEIRGVPPNTRYSVYCLAASRSGSAETSEEEMWANALEVTSFGKFCEVPLTPAVLTEGPATPFDPLTPAEEHLVRDFLRTQQHLKLEGVYRVNLYADKEAILNYYEKNAAFPLRYARVRAGSCDNGKGAFRQFKIGPLPDTQEADASTDGGREERRTPRPRGEQRLQLTEIGQRVETDCGGYNPQGVFGRRLLAEEEEDTLDAVLYEAFGFNFGRKKCKYEDNEGVCAVYGPFIFKEEADGILGEIWIGLKVAAGAERIKRVHYQQLKQRQLLQQQDEHGQHEKKQEGEKSNPFPNEENRWGERGSSQLDKEPPQKKPSSYQAKQQQQAGKNLHQREQETVADVKIREKAEESGKSAVAQPQEVWYLPFYFVASPPSSLRKFDGIPSILLPENPEYIEQLLTEVKGYWMNGLSFNSLEELWEAFHSRKHPQLSPSALRQAVKRPGHTRPRESVSSLQQSQQQPEHEHLAQGLLFQEKSNRQQGQPNDASASTVADEPLSLWGGSPPFSPKVDTTGPSLLPSSEAGDFLYLSRRLRPRLLPTAGLLDSRPLTSGLLTSRLLKVTRRLASVPLSTVGPAFTPHTPSPAPLSSPYPVTVSSQPAKAVALQEEAMAASVSPSQPPSTRRLSTPSDGALSVGPAHWPGPDPRGRGGLEYRAGPEHVEPQGKRYTIKHNPLSTSYSLEYLGWSMTITNDRDTSLRVWNLRFNGQRYAFELGVNEALAHYSVAERHWYFMDSWYGGLGAAARRVHPGVECPKTATVLFFDLSLCVFEQDKARPLRSHWKAGVLRDAAPHYVLVLRQIITVSNYDYITDYVFHANGFFEATMAFTGELYAGVEVPWFSARQAHHGTQVTGSMRMGALHAHLASWKIDFDLDNYKENSILWHEVKKDPARPGALKLDTWIADTEEQGYFKFNDTRPLHYQVIHEDHNIYKNFGGFTVLPLPTIAIPNPDFELFSGPAAWAKYRILTTLRKEEECHGSLPRDNKYALRPAVSLDRFMRDNDNIRRKDVVTWVASAVWHIPVIEDMPQTLSLGNTLGFMVKPHNFFTEDVSMDLHNALGGAVQDPGTCAIIRQELEKYLAE